MKSERGVDDEIQATFNMMLRKDTCDTIECGVIKEKSG